MRMEFEWGDDAGVLEKSFLARKRCALSLGPRQWEGVEAEDQLATLFGFSYAAKGASRPEHTGIPGLLWMEQGQGHLLDVAPAREHLHDALAGDAGTAWSALAASGGDDLLGRVQALRAELLTGTGKARGALAEALSQVQEAEVKLADTDAQLARYAQAVDQWTRERDLLWQEQAERPWEALRAQLAQAQAEQAALAAHEQRCAEDQARLDVLAQTRRLLRDQLQAADSQAQDAEWRQATLQQAASALQEAELRLRDAQAPVLASKRAAVAAREALQAARRQAQRQQSRLRHEQAAARCQASEQALGQARKAQAELAVRQAEAAALRLSESDLEALRQKESACLALEAQGRAVATRIEWHSSQTTAVAITRVDGSTAGLLASGEPQWLDAEATLLWPDGSRLHITPGGADLAQWAAHQAQALAAFRADLERLQVADVAEAHRLVQQARQARSELALAQQALKLLAPRGMEALQAEHQAALDELLAAQAALEALGPLEAVEGSREPLGDAAELDTLEQAVAQAQSAEAEALSQQAMAQQAQVRAHSQYQQAQQEAQLAQAALAAPERAEALSQARSKLLEVTQHHEALAARLAQAQAQHRAARPDIVAQDVRRLSQSIAQWVSQHQQRREAVAAQHATLVASSALGLQEQRDALASQWAQADRRASELQRRAQALDLLSQRLAQKRQASLSALQAPLQRKLQRYLELLFPLAEISLDEHLMPRQLHRPSRAAGLHEELPALSFGAREQMFLITRLAYADLLKEAGRPTLLILDDALVHTDAERLPAMKRVLFDAAQRHQVLLFSCHPEMWRDLGVPLQQLPTSA
ncbi:ATP-binding protein [Ideonella paludis]|uniref:ATP-binding protein n=1 Tax=Ideonella paludis TaxID=1233411 RepID=UPI00363154BA